MREMCPCLLEFTVLWEMTDSKQVKKKKKEKIIKGK